MTQVSWFQRPKTIPAQIFLCSYAAFSLLIVCAYQAQLTAITHGYRWRTRVSEVLGYSEIIDRDGSVCIPGSSQWYQDYFYENYPNLKLYTQCQSIDQCLNDMLRHDKCMAVVWDEATLERKVSENCGLKMWGADSKFLTMNIVAYMSRFALSTNYGVRSIAQRLRMESLAAAINHELIRLRDDGSLDELYKKWFMWSSRCNEERYQDADTPPSFDVENIAGIFLIHVIVGW